MLSIGTPTGNRRSGASCPHDRRGYHRHPLGDKVADYLDLDDLLALDIDDDTAARLLHESPLTGHGGRPVVDVRSLDLPDPGEDDD